MPDPFPPLPTRELAALLAAARAEPEDDAPRQVLADWLEEHGDPRAEVVRLSLAAARAPSDEEREALQEAVVRWQEEHGWPGSSGLPPQLQVGVGRGLLHLEVSPFDDPEAEWSDDADHLDFLLPLPEEVAALLQEGWVESVELNGVSDGVA